MLSHIAIRARAQKVLLATCFDRAQFEALQQRTSSMAGLSVDARSNVVVSACPEATETETGKKSVDAGTQLELAKPKLSKGQSWVLTEREFTSRSVGGKSGNLAALRAKLGGLPGTAVPPSLALPFGTFEEVISSKCNAEVKAEADRLSKAVVRGRETE